MQRDKGGFPGKSSYPVISAILASAIHKFMAGDAKGGIGGTQREVCYAKGVKGGFPDKERFLWHREAPRQREANPAMRRITDPW